MISPTTVACSRETFVETAARLPAAPQVLAEIYELLLDPHLQLEDIVEVIRRDAALAAGVVRIANSAIYFGGRVGSIEDAVARLGLAEVYRAVGLATTARFAALALPCYGVSPGRVGVTALLHALAAEAIAPFVGLDPLISYTTGLLRPMGLMVIDQLVRARGEVGSVVTDSSELLATERNWVGTTNPEVAALVLESWRVAPDVVNAVRGQYLLNGLDSAPRLAVALNLAGAMVAALNGALKAEMDFWIPNPAKLQRLGLTEEQLLCAQEHTQQRFEHLRVALD
jgi:HD-like signal output (HDOD) protein